MRRMRRDNDDVGNASPSTRREEENKKHITVNVPCALTIPNLLDSKHQMLLHALLTAAATSTSATNRRC
jgi:hypothetical protein